MRMSSWQLPMSLMIALERYRRRR